MPKLHIQFPQQHWLRAKVKGHPLAEGAKHATRELNVHTVAGVAIVVHILKLLARSYLVLGAIYAQKAEVEPGTVVEECHLLQCQLKLSQSFCFNRNLGGYTARFYRLTPGPGNCNIKLLIKQAKKKKKKRGGSQLLWKENMSGKTKSATWTEVE